MQPPKILWLKRNRPECFAKIEHFMDLSDWLAFAACGSLTRSRCTVSCKWLYSGDSWDKGFWSAIGLPELSPQQLGEDIRTPGSPIGALTSTAAEALGLPSSAIVSTGLIDAHAGLIGSLGCCLTRAKPNQILFAIAGTSTCHLALSDVKIAVPGVWGPYFGTMLPNKWNAEAGQNCVAPVLDMIVTQYGGFLDVEDRHALVRKILSDFEARNGTDVLTRLAVGVDVLPDYHGNRSPEANLEFTGIVAGLRLTTSESQLEYLLKIYLAHVQAFALQTRHIVQTLCKNGYGPFAAICMTGGLARNRFYVQAHADALQLPVIIPLSDQTVAYGAAILAAFGSQQSSNKQQSPAGSLEECIAKFAPKYSVVRPNLSTKKYFDRKYAKFHLLMELERQLRSKD